MFEHKDRAYRGFCVLHRCFIGNAIYVFPFWDERLFDFDFVERDE